jgi:uncharacterized protein (TIGR02611 family)
VAEHGAGQSEGRAGRLARRVQHERDRYSKRGRVFRVAWVLAGIIVVAAGVAMVVFPGPALIVIPAGLLMLSMEFAWAQRLLDVGIDRGEQAKDVVAGASREQKILGAAALVCAIATVAIVAGVILL